MNMFTTIDESSYLEERERLLAEIERLKGEVGRLEGHRLENMRMKRQVRDAREWVERAMMTFARIADEIG